MKILNNLFSIFDPSCYSASSSWMMLFIPLVMTIFMLATKLSFMKKLILMYASKEFTLRPNKDKPINLTFFLIIFTIVLSYNIMGLIAFSFTVTAQIAVTFSISTIILVSIWTYDWSFSLMKYFAHLCTKGGPLWLAMLIVLIEFISMMIRPITLSIRLTANMMAGHLLMSLLFGMISWLGLPLLLPVAMALFILELAVSVIQAYVITMLISEYYSEVYEMYKLISN